MSNKFSLECLSKHIDVLEQISVIDFKTKYLTDIPLTDNIDDSFLEFHLKNAIVEIESFLQIKIKLQINTDTLDYNYSDWGVNYTSLRVNFPIFQLISVKGKRKENIVDINLPLDLLSIRKSSDNKSVSRTISILYNQSVSLSHSQLSLLYRTTFIPNYWEVKYITGWIEPPSDILNAIYMLATCSILQTISDSIMSQVSRDPNNINSLYTPTYGRNSVFELGLTQKSISIDGVTQSYSSYVNGTTGIYGAKLKLLAEQLDVKKPGSLMNRLHDTYCGLNLGVL